MNSLSEKQKGGIEMFRFFLISLMSVSLLLFACSKKEESTKKVDGLNMKEGKWEITVAMQATGKMPFQMPPQTFTQCITKENTVPQKVEPNQDCKITKQEVKGDTVSWTAECKTPEGPVITDGTVTYKGTTFDGMIKIKQKDMEITQNMSGKWIGECK